MLLLVKKYDNQFRRFKLGFTPHEAIKSLQSTTIQRKEKKDEKYKRKLIGENPKIKDSYQSRPKGIQIIIHKQCTGKKIP